jgi:hypothetical protein
MKTCPACSERGIAEHSVLIELDPSPGTPRSQALAAYTRCAHCGAGFRFDDAHALTTAEAMPSKDRAVWIVPPWMPHGAEADLELSWDDATRALVAEASLLKLMGELRPRGFGSRLYAAATEGRLVLRRDADGGPTTRHVVFGANEDGSVQISAVLARSIAFRLPEARWTDDVELVVNAVLAG